MLMNLLNHLASDPTPLLFLLGYIDWQQWFLQDPNMQRGLTEGQTNLSPQAYFRGAGTSGFGSLGGPPPGWGQMSPLQRQNWMAQQEPQGPNLQAGGTGVGVGQNSSQAGLQANSANTIGSAGQYGNWGANVAQGTGATGAAAGAAPGTAWWANPRLWGGVVGGIGSYLDSRQQNQNAGAGGNTDMYNTSDPWGPSSDYRNVAMQQALGLLQGQGQGGGGGGGGRGGRGGRGGGGGGFGNSQQLANAMSRFSQAQDPLVNQGRDFISGALNDQYGGSELLGRTFERANTFGDQDLNQFITNMMGDWGAGGGGGGSLNNPMGAYRSGGSGGGGGGNHALIGMNKYIKDMLDSEYSQQNPELQNIIDQANRGTTEAYQSGLAGLSAAGNQAGAGTSSAYQLADAAAAGQFSRGLAENESGLRYEDFQRYRDEIMQAMGLGTQYDLGMANVDAQNRATRSSSASASQANALQRELGNRGLLLDAFGLRQGYGEAGLNTMAGLSGIDVQNRQFLLGAIPQYHDIPMSDMERAFGANFGLDQAQARARAEAAARAQENSRYQANLPWQRLAQYMDIVNGASSGYGTEHQYGTQPTGQQQTSNWGQALMGALGGAQLAGNLYSSYRS